MHAKIWDVVGVAAISFCAQTMLYIKRSLHTTPSGAIFRNIMMVGERAHMVSNDHILRKNGSLFAFKVFELNQLLGMALRSLETGQF